ncbi:hypothetical protein K474DRAFT_1656361 [Panus rudis PR-1116 ss-1]|nr:hypothetical protein K474DRAFT_1656361 [Panus rudis PR-1116 ss-1]
MPSGTGGHREPAETRLPNYPYSTMPYAITNRPTSPTSNATAQALPTSNASSSTTRRSSRIPDFIGGLRRNRTTSLPPRPKSADGHLDIDDSADSVASSSFASGVSPRPRLSFPAIPVKWWAYVGARSWFIYVCIETIARLREVYFPRDKSGCPLAKHIIGG